MSDTSQSPVNSEPYWDHRFGADWESNCGRQQTAFFARIALGHLPAWFARDVRRDSLTFCDWGCAEGDGVDVLAAGLQVPVTGIDFAASAIEKAKAYYPARQFMQSDFLSGDNGLRFDVVFSSNTLEHFVEPWQVFIEIAKHANKYVVLLLPFQEYERIVEHFATFDFDCIPMDMGGFNLVHGHVIDTGAMMPNYWPGKQILLIYARRELLGELRLVLEDVRIDHPQHLAAQTALVAAQTSLSDSQVAVQTSLVEAQAVLHSQANALIAELEALRAAHGEGQAQLVQVQVAAEEARLQWTQLNAQCADLVRERNVLVGEQAVLVEERNVLRSKVAAADARHEDAVVLQMDLNKAQDTARAALEELNQIRSSFSWRITGQFVFLSIS